MLFEHATIAKGAHETFADRSGIFAAFVLLCGVSLLGAGSPAQVLDTELPMPGLDTVAVDAVTNRAYVGSPYSATVTVIDLSTHQVTNRIPVPEGVHGITVDSVSRVAFVPGGRKVISVIDLRTHEVIDRITVDGPAAMNLYRADVNPDTQMIYVAGRSGVGTEGIVVAIDGSTYRVTGTILIPESNSRTDVVVDASTNTLYSVGRLRDLYAIDGATNTVSSITALPFAVSDLALDSDLATLYVRGAVRPMYTTSHA